MPGRVVTHPNSTDEGTHIPRPSTPGVRAEEYTEEYFALLARRYLLNDGWSQQRVRDIVHLVRPEPGERILDVGCGAGVTAIEAAKRGAWVAALDYAMPGICAARRLEAVVLGGRYIRFLQADGIRLPIGANSMDKIAAMDFVEHITRRQFEAFAAEASRALQPGGELLIYTPNSWDFIDRASGAFLPADIGSEPAADDGRASALLRNCARFVWRHALAHLLRRPRSVTTQDMLPVRFPILPEAWLAGAHARYEHLHVDLKPPKYLISVLRRAGLHCQQIRVTRSPWWLSALPHPLGTCWGGWLAATFEKNSTATEARSQEHAHLAGDAKLSACGGWNRRPPV